jgi:hypothetical protein
VENAHSPPSSEKDIDDSTRTHLLAGANADADATRAEMTRTCFIMVVLLETNDEILMMLSLRGYKE